MKYLSNAFEGSNHWWRYLFLFIASFLGGQTIGGIPLMAVMFYKIFESGNIIQPNPENLADLSVYGIDQNLGLFLMILPFLVSLIILFLLFKPFHRRNYKTLFSGVKTIRWKRFFIAAGLWTLLSVLYFAGDIYLNPQNFVNNFNAGPFLMLILISLSLIPFQASYEEVLFRGYLAQGFAVLTKNRIMVILIPSILFGLMHSLNPEVDTYGFWIVMPQYIFFGLLFGLITVMDDGIELAMGAHTANNVFMSIFITSKSSVLQTPALFIQQNVDALKELYVLIAMSIIFIIILGYLFKWNFSILSRKIEPLNRESEGSII
jgi:membrane protease YdiL (CAAX protease family)